MEANERLAQLALASSAKQGDYVIGSGDLLGVEVFDVPELSRDVRVNETGYISLPLLPVKIQAAGLTSFQLQDKIAELLQTNGLVSAPQVTVSLKRTAQPAYYRDRIGEDPNGNPGGPPDDAGSSAFSGRGHRG